MKTLTAGFLAEMVKVGAAPINVLEIDFPAPTGTKYYSDKARTIGANTYVGMVAKWPDRVTMRVSDDPRTPDIGDLTIVLVNSQATPESDIFNTINPEGSVARLYQTFDGLTLADRDLMFKGTVGGVEWDEAELRITIISGIAKDKVLGTRVKAADYAAADPDEIGKIKPLVWGAVKNARSLAVAIGAFDLLRADVAAAATTVTLSDASRFPSSGNALIGTDTFAYTGKTGNDLTGCSGVLAHKKGDMVWESRTTYDFLMAGHAVKQVDAVRVNGLLVPAADYTIDLPNGLIKFSVQPISEFLSEHLHNVAGTGGSTLKQFPISTTPSIPTWIDGIDDTHAAIIGEFTINFPNTDYGGTISAAYYWILHNGATARTFRVNEAAGRSLGTSATWAGGAFKWQRFADPTPASFTWADDIYCNSSPAPGIDIAEVYREVEYIGGLTEISKQVPGLDFWRGAVVTWDGQGRKDDASGTITGTANALIERPDHVIKDILVNLLSYVSADIDATSFNDAGTQYGATYKFAGVYNQQMQARDFLAALALQARAWFWWDGGGKAHLTYRRTSKAADDTINNTEVVDGSLSLARRQFEDVRNRINVHYDFDWEQEQGRELIQDTHDPDRIEQETPFKASVISEDATSQTNYGLKERSYFFPFVPSGNSAMAQDLADFYKTVLKDPKLQASFRTHLPYYDIERGDWFSLTYSHFGLTAKGLEIAGVSYILGSVQGRRADQVEFEGEERTLI